MNYKTEATNGAAVAVETHEAQRAMTGADVVLRLDGVAVRLL